MDPRLTGLDLKTLALSTSDFLMPRICLCCGRQLLAGERHLCSVCLADLPLTRFEGVLHNPMADKYNGLVSAPAYERACALFYYTGGYRKITQALKYGRNFGAGRFFARMLGERLAAGESFDLVCPVPLHWTRRFTRGYNQAEVIGREVARVLEVPFEPRLLRRMRRTGTQTKLSAEERAGNIAGAFEVRLSHCSSTKRGRIVDKRKISDGSSTNKDVFVDEQPLRILLVDDVFTTGATVAACAAALRAAFGPDVRISVATLAFSE